jgi:glutathione synthase/RimK-type ligase-like ATP-grasp enzyme
MILVITKTNDNTADYVLQKMRNRGVSYVRLDSDKFAMASVSLYFETTLPSIIVMPSNQRIQLEDISAIWLRRLVQPEVSNNFSNKEARIFAEQEENFMLRWLVDSFSCSIIDREADIIKARNKFTQLQLAKDIGLQIPPTLVTNDPFAARQFVDEYKHVAIKSIAGYGRRLENGFEAIYTHIVTPEIFKKFDSIRFAPVCLQQYINKKFELRITVVGEKIFACRLNSQQSSKTKIDWRKGNVFIEHSKYSIEPDVETKILKMMRYFHIHFAAFDFIMTPNDELVFLEMNPGGQFVWIEELTGMPITDALIDELLNHGKSN